MAGTLGEIIMGAHVSENGQKTENQRTPTFAVKAE